MNNEENMSEEMQNQEELQREVKNNVTNTKIVTAGAKAAANYFAPGVGGKVVDIASKTRIGGEILNAGGQALTGVTKATPFGDKIQDTLNKADDAGVIDAAGAALDATSGGTGMDSAAAGSSALDKLDSASSFLGKDSGLSSDSNLSPSDSLGKNIKLVKINPIYFAFIGGIFFIIMVVILMLPNTTLDLTGGNSVAQNNPNTTNLLTDQQIENLLIYVGDSRIAGMKNTLNKNHITYIAESGKGYYWFGETAKNELSAYIAADTQKFVVFNLGINDLTNIDQYINIYNSIIASYKNVKFYFMSVNPVNEELAVQYGYTITNNDIEKFNQKISSTFVNYIDVYNEINDDFITSDGLHYDETTNQRINNLVVNYIKQRTNISFLEKYPTVKESTALMDISIASALGESGITALNNFINSQISMGGKCTGIGVAGAATGLIYGLHDQGYHLPYYYGGGHGTNNGIDPKWGTNIGASIPTPKGNVYYYGGLDCSGFVAWAMNTSGVSGGTVAGKYTNYGKIIEYEALSPGDLLDNDSHVIMVVENKGTYLQCAESTGGGVQFTTKTKNDVISAGYRMIDMDGYYQNNCT